MDETAPNLAPPVAALSNMAPAGEALEQYGPDELSAGHAHRAYLMLE